MQQTGWMPPELRGKKAGCDLAVVLEAAAFTRPMPDDTAGSFPLRALSLKLQGRAGECLRAGFP